MHVTRGSYVMVVMSLMVTMTLCSLDQSEKEYILNLHNEYRASEGASNMAKLEWDDTLEQEAVTWADRCVYAHKGMGENLAWNSMVDKPQKELIDRAMKAFHDEKERYTYGQNSCGSTMACHYTQMSWAKTTKVGCATKMCEPLTNAYNKAWFLVCRFDPPGNWDGEKPFLLGEACSKCNSQATCEDGLCVGGTEGGEEAAGGEETANCEDNNGDCKVWADRGDCDSNKDYMSNNCRKSCGICVSGDESAEECEDGNGECQDWAGRGECTANPSYMDKHCRKSCNKC